MTLRVGINGLGRIGRQALRSWITRHRKDFDVVAANDLTDRQVLAHLLRHDTVYGPFPGSVEVGSDSLVLDGMELPVFEEPEPDAIPWGRCNVDVVVEATGRFRVADEARRHLGGAVKKVLISTNGNGEDLTMVYGVNHGDYRPAEHHILSAGSCTTNCVVPLADVLHREFGIRSGFLTTVHSYTSSQNLVDAKNRDLRRARAAAENIVPTGSGAVDALGKVLPDLRGKIGGLAMRVPTPTVSITDLVTELERPATVDAINEVFARESYGRLRGILAYETEQLVSTDFREHPASAVFDAPLTSVNGSLAKTLAWYDNEWGYACRITDLCALLAERGIE
jgi:glyceraldehyde 3-phosphate dehydrogenase